ncbi:unnamed protein product [Caenorhabditis nigoni]
MIHLRNRQIPRAPVARRAHAPAPPLEGPRERVGVVPRVANAQAQANQAPPANHDARITFKDIKNATDALASIIPKFSGEKDEDTFALWIQKYTQEANALRLGRLLTTTVFPRMLSGTARLKYDLLTNEERADFALATQALAERLNVQRSRAKAMNEWSTATKKSSEAMIKFARRVETLARAAFPNLNEEQREELTRERFIQGLPHRIRVKILERNVPDTLEETLNSAERLEEILKEEDRETINLIDQVNKSSQQDVTDQLRQQIKELSIENKKQKRLIDQITNNSATHQNYQNQNNFQRFVPQQNNQRVRFSRSETQRNRQYPRSSSNFERNFGNRSESRPRGGWQPNRAPMQSGIHFLMIVTCLALTIQTAACQFQICPNVRSGEYFAPPQHMTCKLNPMETVVKTMVDIYTEFGASQKAKAYRCSNTIYSVCSGGSFQRLMGKPNIVNITSVPMSTEDCKLAIDQHQVKNRTLISKGNGVFHSTPTMTRENYWTNGGTCNEGIVYTLEIGEIATPDGEKVISPLGDTAGCIASMGECELTDSRIVWKSEGITKFCKYSKVETTEAYITKTKIAIPSLQIALEIVQNQNDSQIENCALRMAVITNNGFMVSIKSHKPSLADLIDSVENKQRGKRSLSLKERPKDKLINRLYGPNSTIEKYPLFSYDPITDPRIIHEMRRYDIAMQHIRYQWENYELPNRQVAVLRAIREGEYRKQLIRELRENDGNLKNAVTIKQLEEPSHFFDAYLQEEFGNARPLSSEERKGKTWTMTGLSQSPPTTRSPLNREQSGVEYIRQISELHRKATENRENSQINGRLQFVTDKIIETSYQEFDRIYHKLCEMQNSQIEISKTLLAIDPTLGMRTLMKRDDVVAKRAGMVYLVTQCSKVTADKVYLDHKVDGKCYVDTPVKIQNQTWFIAPGMEKDLIKESAEIPCDEVTLGIYKDEKGNWKSLQGLSVVRNIPVSILQKAEKLNLTLSAPPVFSKLENIDNPFAYLATWTSNLLKIKETQWELMRNMRNEGLSSEIIEDLLGKGANGVMGIAGEIQKSINEGTSFIRNQITSFLKTVIMPIVIILILAGTVIIAFKIYFVRKAAGMAFSELAKITRKAPPTIQQMIRKWRPEVHNIMLREDGPTELDVFSIERSDSVVTIPMIATILTESRKDDVPRIEIAINGEKTEALLDTGAEISLITFSMIRQLRLKNRVTRSQSMATTVNGKQLSLLGKVTEIVSMGNHRVIVDFYITKNKEVPVQCILGMDVINRLGRQNVPVSMNMVKRFISIGCERLEILNYPSKEMLECSESHKDDESVISLDEEDMAWTHKSLAAVQRMSQKIQKIREAFQKKQASPRLKNMFYFIDDVVHRIPHKRNQTPPVLLFSCEDAKQLARDLHYGNHLKFHKLMKELEEIAVWKGMRRDVREVIKECKTCQSQNSKSNTIYSIMTVGGRTHLPFAPIHLDETPIVALLDSGASVSLIPERILKVLKLQGKVTRTDCSAKVANGTHLKFLGKVSVIITIGNTSVSHELMITENEGAPAACLLGIDFINALNKKGKLVTFNMTKKCVQIGDTPVKLLNPHEYGHESLMSISVACANDEIIPPRCTAIIAGEMPGVKIRNKEFVIFDFDRETDDFYTISSTLSRMDTEGKVVIQINNPGNAEIVLKKGDEIAVAEVWKGTETVSAVHSIQPDNQNAEAILAKIDLEKSALSTTAKQQVRQMIRRYHNAFVGIDGKIGRFKGVTTHHIELNDDHRIPQSRPYRLNPEQKAKLEKEIQHMKDNGLIEESSSPYTSPLLMIPKPNGDTRIVIDYRRLNLITRSRTYIMPNTIDVTEEASKGKIFSVFDIAQGFHTIKMNEAHKERTAFCCHMGVFQYRFMPMGLKGAPDTFQRAMAEVEKQFSGTMILYVDDLIVVSKTEDQHMKDLDEFFKLMIKMGLKLKAEKSQIGRTRISFLGFVIENNTIRPNEEKTKSIRNFPTPKSVTDVKSFLGMSGYFRRFIEYYGIITKPLTVLTKKDTEFVWGNEQKDAFEKIKEKLISPPILTTPWMDGKFEMHTDASKIGIAAVLLQEQNGELKVVAYASRPTSSIEQKYVAIELEALAITWGLNHYRPYIFGKKVKVVTDHQPLKSLLHRKEKELSGRLLRHQAIIQMYDVEIVYRPGKENPLADALSRQKFENEEVMSIEVDREITTNLEAMQHSSAKIQRIKKALLEKDENEDYMNYKNKFMLINNLVHGIPRRDEQLPPIVIEGRTKESRTLIINIHKANNHIGIPKMIAKMENIAIWNEMKQEISETLRTCEECQLRKIIPAFSHVVPMGTWEVPKRPFQRVHVDVMGPLPETIHGNRLIIVATDAFSKFAVARAIRDQTAETTIKFLIENLVSVHGIPEEIVSDQGRNFISKTFEKICEILEMKHSMSPAYHHQTNGAVERLNRTLEEMLTLATSDPKNYLNWDEKLPLVIQSYNASYHSTVKYAPEYIVFGRITVSPADIIINSVRPIYCDEGDMIENLTEAIRQCHEKVHTTLEKAQQQMKNSHDKRMNVKEPEFRNGDKVVIKNEVAGKLMYQFSKPAIIISTTETTVTVQTASGKFETIHKNRAKKFLTPIGDGSMEAITHLPSQPTANEGPAQQHQEKQRRSKLVQSRSKSLEPIPNGEAAVPRRSRRLLNLPP